MIYIYIIFIILVISYLTGFFENYQIKSYDYNIQHSSSLIEFLTQYKTKTKNYSKPPANFSTFGGKAPVGKIIKDEVLFRYEFPLINSKKAVYECFLKPHNISSLIDCFGLENHFIVKDQNGYTLNDQLYVSEFTNNMNKYGWYFNSKNDFGVDYRYLVKSFIPFTRPISRLIYNELLTFNHDSYFNRVQASLNFVQFLHYGLPDFDSEEWYYFGVATPPESFILGYSDCDSKSIFFASILSELIPAENIILVNCIVNSTNEANDGNHMMVAVCDLGIDGQSLVYNDKNYLLLETTSPCIIGQFDWESFSVQSIVPLYSV